MCGQDESGPGKRQREEEDSKNPPGRGNSSSSAGAMPHFLNWFVPMYLMISVLILVGFGACIYYFELGLQEAHKWRTQGPVTERDLRKTSMIRDNLAFGVPEV